MVTLPLVGILAILSWFMVQAGRSTIGAAVVMILFGFLLGGTVAAPAIHDIINTVAHHSAAAGPKR